jgi:hypothetical protein
VQSPSGSLAGKQFAEHTQLAIFLLEDAEACQKYKAARDGAPGAGADATEPLFLHYHTTLPRDCSNFPIFWPQREVSWLAESSISAQITSLADQMESDYNTVCRVTPEFSRFTLDQWQWARIMVLR